MRPLIIVLFVAAIALGQSPEVVGPWKQDDFRLYVTFTVRETAGIAREREPVEVSVRLPSREIYVVRQEGKPEEIVSQVVEATPDGAAWKMRIAFPATVPARSSVRYRVYYGDPQHRPPAYSPAEGLKVSEETRVGWIVENAHYAADASQRTVRDQEEDSGQVRAVTIKGAGVTLLRSSGPRMHWAPNFQRAGAASYTGVARWHPVQTVNRAKGPVVAESQRSGFHHEYPEIALSAVYRFFAFVPYFWFRSEMRVVKPIELSLMRNDEMTMDGFFTHLAWPGAAPPAVHSAAFDEREAILKDHPIPANAPWVCFYNAEKGYGFGSVRLLFDTKNAAGGSSPLYQPHTKISDGAGGGKYWNRRLVHERNTMLPAGSRYAEENAYVVFRVRPGGPAQAIGEFLEWEAKLRRPLAVQMVLSQPGPAKKR